MDQPDEEKAERRAGAVHSNHREIPGQAPEVASPREQSGQAITLNLMRAVAAFGVLFFHLRADSFIEYSALPAEHRHALTALFFGLTRLGQEFVIVFFVLSGFLVGGQVIRHCQQARFDIRSYVIERGTRILLPLVPACLLTVAVGWFAFGMEPNWLQVIANMFGLNGVAVETLSNNIPLWTIAFEIWFYAIAGAVGHLFATRSASLVALLVIAIGVCVFCILDARYFLFWGLGALVVFFLATPARRALAILGACLFVGGTLTFQLGSESRSFSNVAYFPRGLSEAFVCIGTCITLPYLCDRKTNAAVRLFRRPAFFLSSLAYSLYLIHYPLIGALRLISPKTNDLSPYAIGMFSLKAALIFVAVYVFYLAFEANTGIVRTYLKRRMIQPKGVSLVEGR